jgi:hypothetical protein
LAFVEWFTEPVRDPASALGYYHVQQAFEQGQRRSSVIQLLDIRHTCRLIPAFSNTFTDQPTHMLDDSIYFFVDHQVDEHSSRILY